MKRINQALLAGLLAAAAAFPAAALDSDAKQPMYIEADSATYDEGKGQTVYAGNVRFSQGSLESQADKMVVYQKDGKADRIETFGNPARVKQTPEAGKPPWNGIGRRAEFFPDTGILVLHEKAMAWQGDKPETSDRVTSERIEYDSQNSVMKAGLPSSRGGDRVHVTLQPGKDESKQ
jgi:lipopolysaccharide export system protein LptA